MIMKILTVAMEICLIIMAFKAIDEGNIEHSIICSSLVMVLVNQMISK